MPLLLSLHTPGLLLLLLCCYLSMLLHQMLYTRRQLAAELLLLQLLPRSQVCRCLQQLLLLHGQNACRTKPHLTTLSRVLHLVLASGRLLCPMGSRGASAALAPVMLLLRSITHGALLVAACLMF